MGCTRCRILWAVGEQGHYYVYITYLEFYESHYSMPLMRWSVVSTFIVCVPVYVPVYVPVCLSVCYSVPL